MLVPTLVVLGSNGMSVITEIHREQWTPASRFIFHGHSRSLDQYFLLVITMSLSCTVSMGDGRRFGMGAKLQRVCGTEVPQQNPGVEPESSRSWIFKVVTSKFYAFLVVFQNFHLYMPMFLFRACRHHSTKSPKWGGIWYRLPTIVCNWGNCPLCPQLRRLWPFLRRATMFVNVLIYTVSTKKVTPRQRAI